MEWTSKIENASIQRKCTFCDMTALYFEGVGSKVVVYTCKQHFERLSAVEEDKEEEEEDSQSYYDGVIESAEGVD
jgi:hypothetical protein